MTCRTACILVSPTAWQALHPETHFVHDFSLDIASVLDEVAVLPHDQVGLRQDSAALLCSALMTASWTHLSQREANGNEHEPPIAAIKEEPQQADGRRVQNKDAQGQVVGCPYVELLDATFFRCLAKEAEDHLSGPSHFDQDYFAPTGMTGGLT